MQRERTVFFKLSSPLRRIHSEEITDRGQQCFLFSMIKREYENPLLILPSLIFCYLIYRPLFCFAIDNIPFEVLRKIRKNAINLRSTQTISNPNVISPKVLKPSSLITIIKIASTWIIKPIGHNLGRICIRSRNVTTSWRVYLFVFSKRLCPYF